MSSEPRAFAAVDRGTATVAASLVGRVGGHWRLLGSSAAPAAVETDAVLERLRTNGVQRAWLRVFAANGRGRAFYDKLGWCWTGERSFSSFAPYPELLRYERDL